MKYLFPVLCSLFLSLACTAQTGGGVESAGNAGAAQGTRMNLDDIAAQTVIESVISDTDFSPWGRLIFPADPGYWSGATLGTLRLTWYSHIDPTKTVEIIRYFKAQTLRGEQVFFDIYTEEEKRRDPQKRNTGLFFFRGKRNAKFAICNAGGGFAYVGAMHDSFPHALELSERGYNTFALIYRPGSQTACEDLARAIVFIHEHASELQVDTAEYSLWGGSAGARMAAWLGNLGTECFGEKAYPRPAAVIMQYTGLSEVTGNEPPTYACVGTADGIASYQVMEDRIRRIKSNGTDAEIEIFEGLPHGFGLGTGTVAEGWIDNAMKFWERNM
jgi:putative lipoprotein